MDEPLSSNTKSFRDRAVLLFVCLGVAACGLYLWKPELFSLGQSMKGDILIGKIESQSGDVRLKSVKSSVWGQGAAPAKLYELDSIYVGAQSKATAQVLKSRLSIGANTLLVLRTQNQNDGMIDLNYGTIESELVDGQELDFLTLGNKKMSVTSKGQSKIVLKKSPHQDVQIIVTSGEASVADSKQTVTVNQTKTVNVQNESLVVEPARVPAQEAAPENPTEKPPQEAPIQKDPEVTTQTVEQKSIPVTQYDNEIHIPRQDYPDQIYLQDDSFVRGYLARKLGRDFFSQVPAANFPFEMNAVNANGARYKFQIQSNALPPTLLSPTTYNFRVGSDPTIHPLRVVLDPTVLVIKAVADQPAAEWQPLLFARGYELQTSADSAFHQFETQRVVRSTANLSTQKISKGFARVRALDGSGRVISDWSNSESFAVVSEKSNVVLSPLAANGKSVEENGPGKLPPSPKFWAWVGTGLKYTLFSQTIPDQASVSANSLQAVNGASADVGFLDSKAGSWGGEIMYRQESSANDFSKISNLNGGSPWKSYGAWALYRGANLAPKDYDEIYPVWKFGINVQQSPFFSLASATSLNQQNLQTISPDVQYAIYLARDRWLSTYGIGYGIPVQYSIDGKSVRGSTIGTLEGILGSSYRFTNEAQLGIYWTGSWSSQQINADATSQESIFKSNLDFRFGFGF